MRRCGQYADGLITDPKKWKEYKAEFQTGASDAGVGGRSELNEAAELWRFGLKAWKPISIFAILRLATDLANPG